MAFLIIIVLILLNGFLAMAEISVVSSRKSKLEVSAQKGNKTARQVMKLVDNPSRFLSTIQVGLTIIGLLTGIFSNDVFAKSLQLFLEKYPLLSPYSREISITLVVIPISFLSIFMGELLPKRIGLANPEVFAMFFAKPISLLTKVSFPFVWLLQVTVEGVFKVLNLKPVTDSAVLEQEIKTLVEEGTSSGSIEEIEQDLVENVFHVGDRKINSLMTHVADIVWVKTSDSVEQVRDILHLTPHGLYPVRDENGSVIGVLDSKRYLLNLLFDGKSPSITDIVKDVHYFHETMSAYKVLEKFRSSRNHFGFVVDEYGQLLGVITINDILDALVGDIVADDDKGEITVRDDGSWLVDARISFADFCKYYDINFTLVENTGFTTLGGLILDLLKHIPQTGEKAKWNGFVFEIVDMDGKRIDKLLVAKTS